jgi:hypothetical protein
MSLLKRFQKMDPDLGAMDHGAEVTRLGAMNLGAEVHNHSNKRGNIHRCGADMAEPGMIWPSSAP